MTRVYATVAAAALAALLGASAWYVLSDRPADAFAQCRQGQVAGGEIGGPFTLVNSAGQTVTDAEVLTKPSLVYFGYTFCPDVCPLDMSRNVEAVDILDQRGIDVTPVFISIDPERDTPETLADYETNLHPKLVALTGSAEQVRAASQAYKTFYKRRDTGDEFYLIDHSTFTYLMLPGTGFVDFFRREITSEQMAESVACFVEAGKAAMK
ncbi:SCO family protein [Rhodobacter calidifons]|uniref:SCO family protein n=1 Tax=Rhodobacter calidifons TaxID=2715277 RepID=A0ABX0G5X4_9RHOB|nr:SCO family protein [Rhodobacter calidifons]NHB76616.1 SCO family protein [Rhodobacter calidifons]